MDECTTVRHKHLSKLADHLLQSSNISQSSKRSSHSDIDDAVNAAMQGLQTTDKEMEKIWKNNLRKKIEKTEKTVDPEMEKIWKNNRLAVYADMEKIWKNNVLTLQGQKKQTIDPTMEQIWKNNLLSIQEQKKQTIDPIMEQVWKNNILAKKEKKEKQKIDEKIEIHDDINIIADHVVKNFKHLFKIFFKSVYFYEKYSEKQLIYFMIHNIFINEDEEDEEDVIFLYKELAQIINSPTKLKIFITNSILTNPKIIWRIKCFNQIVFNISIQDGIQKQTMQIVNYFIKFKNLILGFDKDIDRNDINFEINDELLLSPMFQVLSIENYDIFVKLIEDDISLLHKKYYLPIYDIDNISTPLVYCNKYYKNHDMKDKDNELLQIRNYILTKIGRNFLFSTKKKSTRKSILF